MTDPGDARAQYADLVDPSQDYADMDAAVVLPPAALIAAEIRGMERAARLVDCSGYLDAAERIRTAAAALDAGKERP